MLNTTVVRVAQALLIGEIGPLETARILSDLESEEHPEALHQALLTFVAVESETDAIPLGAVRDQWHPDSRAKEDAKLAAAIEWARPMVVEACEQIVQYAREKPYLLRPPEA